MFRMCMNLNGNQVYKGQDDVDVGLLNLPFMAMGVINGR